MSKSAKNAHAINRDFLSLMFMFTLSQEQDDFLVRFATANGCGVVSILSKVRDGIYGVPQSGVQMFITIYTRNYFLQSHHLKNDSSDNLHRYIYPMVCILE